MTWALETQAKQLVLPPIPGVSPRAIRAVLAAMCRQSQQDGSFRYGFRGSRIATLADHSLAVVRRVQKWAVHVGILERVETGGGRKSTKWRIVLDKLLSFLPEKTRQKSPPDTPNRSPRHSPRARTGLSLRMLGRGRPQLGSRLQGESSPEVVEVCIHGGDASLNSFGVPRCPGCRSKTATTRT